MENKMKKTIAFVTGGASGMGKAVVNRIIKNGGRVIIVDVNPNGQKFAESLGDRAIFILADVTSETDMVQALDLAKKIFGGINVVINAAGIVELEKPYDFHKKKPHSIEVYKRVMNVNVFGTFNVTRLAAGLIADNPSDENNQRGVIINFSSIFGYEAPGDAMVYGTSKAAIAGMTRPLARAFAPKGIRVVALAPGFTETPMISAFGEETKRVIGDISFTNLSPKREARPDEMAHMIQCIIENPFINANVMRVDGGYQFVPPDYQQVIQESS